MLRWLTGLSFLFFLLLAGATIGSYFRPINFIVYDPAGKEHPAWSGYRLRSLEDFEEPREAGYYPRPTWDVGFVSFAVFVRASQFVPSQIDKGAALVDVDFTPFERFDHRPGLGIRWERVHHMDQTSVFFLMPVWLPLGLLLLLPGRFLWTRWKGRQRTLGGCRTCGYDMRGHSTGKCCPECGTASASTLAPH
jgi:hypothetical protein